MTWTLNKPACPVCGNVDSVWHKGDPADYERYAGPCSHCGHDPLKLRFKCDHCGKVWDESGGKVLVKE